MSNDEEKVGRLAMKVTCRRRVHPSSFSTSDFHSLIIAIITMSAALPFTEEDKILEFRVRNVHARVIFLKTLLSSCEVLQFVRTR